MNWTSIIRNLLLMLGGIVSGTGFVSSSEWEQIVGVLLIVGTAIWKWIVARSRKAELAAAIAAPAGQAK